ncbi:hypothetical protein OVS_04135 [Mycoplasma ovis str. Michigan]|uniref:Lipoprotein n=1 Tax=Mycoplasma ovis str. Michigan TaxID=1415773 RepID=A0ABN4BS33_9MOLU|nr:hypothetical protein [Mycoplasma ovis]AHC40554.1 hypothetical protein OVS_04135 [Mycoplasma ovis str. Michigan]
MSLGARIAFALATLCGGSCVSIPFYFHSATTVAGATNKEHRGECEVISLENDLEIFLQGKKKDKDDYVVATCKNTGFEKDNLATPTEVWTGLFPKTVLSDKSLELGNKKFEVKIEVVQEEGDSGSIRLVTFSGKGVTNTIKGQWTYLDDILQERKIAVSVDIQGEDFNPNSIYFVIPLPEGVEI